MIMREEKIKELIELAKKTRNLHGIENIEEVMSFGIGDNIYKILDIIEELGI